MLSNPSPLPLNNIYNQKSFQHYLGCIHSNIYELISSHLYSTIYSFAIMKYSLFAFALGVTATVLDDTPSRVERDLPTITNVVATVGQSLAALDNAVANFQGDVNQLTGASTALQSALTSGTTTIQNTTPLTLNDALTLQSVVGSLQTQAQSLVTNLANKKQQLQQANLCEVIRQQSDTLNRDSQTLISAIVGKVPTEVQGVAQQLADGFTATLQQNSANFAQGNCTNANGGGGGVGGGLPTTTFGTGFPTTTGVTRTTSGFGSPTTTGFFTSGTGLPRTTGGTFRPTTGGFGVPTGTSRPTVVTAAAASNAVGLGGVALMVAAFLA